jgi:hypothetical protein
MNTKNVILATAIAAVLLVAAAGSASATDCSNAIGGPGSCNCGDTVVGDYTFDGDMTCPTGYGLIMGADGITIDGAGHTLDGVNPGGCTGSFPHTGIMNVFGWYGDAMHFRYNNVTIENLEIKNFCNGIYIKGSEDYIIYNNTIYNCSIHHNGNPSVATGIHGIKALFVCNSSITHNTVYNNTAGVAQGCEAGGDGIFLKGTPAAWGYADYNLIVHNNIFDNRKAGIFLKAKPRFNNVSYNTLTGNGQGGIILRCKCTDHNNVSYNDASNNWGSGIHIGGNYNNLTNNIACNNKNGSAYTALDGGNGCGISIGRSDGTSANNAMFDNTVCGNEHIDIYVMFGSGNHGDENTCDTTSNYDDDGTTGCTYSCFKINGSAFNKYGNPVDLDKVDISNRNYTDKKWTAKIDGDYYELFIGALKDPGGLDPDISPNEELLIVGCEEISTHEYNCNVTNHTVEQADISNGGITKDLTLNHYCLNYYPDYPYYTKEQDNWSGPAVMQACIGHYYDIGDVPSQAELNETGIANNTACNADLQYVDPYGMQWTLNRNWMWRIGRNYGLYYRPNTTAGLNAMLHYTCYWQHLGPAPVPAYGDYSNWMAVRGIHTSENPYPQSQGSYDIYGFWINDPNDGPESIGENTYKTVDQWTDEYYHNLSGVRDCDNYQYMYVGLFEPPEQPDREVRLVPARPRFDGAITPMLAEEPMMMYGTKQLALEKVVKDDELLKIVKAAIDSVNEELVPYDPAFAAVFAKTVPGEPKLVSSDNGDYYVVPFNVPVEVRLPVKKMPVELERPKISGLKKLERVKRVADKIELKPIPIEPIRVEKTLVVVLVDAEDGSFKEASWVEEPVKYLPVSKIEAMKLALGELLDELRIVAKKDARDLGVLKQKPTIELVYRDASPYYPDWKVTVNGKVFYVGQDGTVSN